MLVYECNTMFLAIKPILGIDQPKVSALKQGKLSGFSIERLMRLLLVLGRDIEITVKVRSKAGSAARLRVHDQLARDLPPARVKNSDRHLDGRNRQGSMVRAAWAE